MNLLFLILAVAGSQFYLYSSGLPQPSHFLFPILLVYYYIKSQGVFLAVSKLKFVKTIYVFLFYVFLVNLIFFALNSEFSFVMAIIYFLYGVAVLLFLIGYLFIDKLNAKRLMQSLFIGNAILFLLALSGTGRYDFFPRFNAFFNDPNQMAFWAICVSASFILLASLYRTNILLVVTVFVFTVFVILSSASRSALIGLIPMLVGLVLMYTLYFKSIVFKFIVLLLSIGLMVYFLYVISSLEEAQYLLDRFLKMNSGRQLEVRGYTRFFEFPEYLIFGAGQGAEFRFNSTHEIHSTWAGIFFYYGAIGMTIFLFFIGRILFSLKLAEKLIFLSPLLYGFSTFGARTPIFWVCIAVAIFVAYQRSQQKNYSFESIS